LTSTLRPSREICIAGSIRAISGSARSTAVTRASWACGATTSIGLIAPAPTSRAAASAPTRTSWSRGNCSSAPLRIVRCSAGIASTSRTAAEPAAARIGRRMIAPVQRSRKDACGSAWRRRRMLREIHAVRPATRPGV
jgi:hypothetical protein